MKLISRRFSKHCLVSIISTTLLSGCLDDDRSDSSSSGPTDTCHNCVTAEDVTLLHPPLSHSTAANNFIPSALSTSQSLFLRAAMDATGALRLFQIDPATDSVTTYDQLPDYSEYVRFHIPETESFIQVEENELVHYIDNQRKNIAGEHSVQNAWLSPDGKKVLFTANFHYEDESNNQLELFISDLSSGQITRLSRTDTPRQVSDSSTDDDEGILLQDPVFLPDMSRVIYVVDTISGTQANPVHNLELRSVNLDGSDNIALDGNIYSGSRFRRTRSFAFGVTPDSKKIIYYKFEINTSGRDGPRVFSINIDGSGPVELTDPATEVQEVYNEPLEITDSQVIYSYFDTVSNMTHLYAANLDGSNRITLTAVTGIYNISNAVVSPEKVFFVGETGGLYSVPRTGGNPTLLNGDVSAGLSTFSYTIRYLPAQQSLIYTAREMSDGDYHLFVTTETGTTTKISSHLRDYESLENEKNSFSVSEDGSMVAYRKKFENHTESKREVYLANIDGSNVQKINPAAEDGEAGGGHLFGWYGNKLYFSFDSLNSARSHLYTYDTNTASTERLIDGLPDYVDEDIVSIRSAENGAFAAISRISGFSTQSFYITQNGNTCSVNVNPGENVVTSNSRLVFREDSKQVLFDVNAVGLYSADVETCQRSEVVLPENNGLAGTAPRIKTIGNDFLVSSGNGLLSHLKEDGSLVILNEATNGGSDIYTNNNGAFNATPDGTRVLYWDKNLHLYAADIDGSNNQRISPDSFALFGLFKPFYFSPMISADSQWVVYAAVNELDNSDWRWFKTPIAGGMTEEFSNSAHTGYSNNKASFSDDGQTLVYLELNASNDFVLNALPNGGSSIQISGQLPEDQEYKSANLLSGNGDNNELNIIQIPDTQTIVYRGYDGQTVNLFSVNLDGTNPRLLTQDLPEGYTVSNFDISQDSTQILFESYKPGVSGSTALFSVSVDGTGLQERIPASEMDDLLYVKENNTVIYNPPKQENGDYLLKALNLSNDTLKTAVVKKGGGKLFIQLSEDKSTVLIRSDFRTFGVNEAGYVKLDEFK